MRQSAVKFNQEWLKVLGKGMITLPKKWREEMGLAEGDIVKAKKEGNKVIIVPQRGELAPYRVYTDEEVNEFLKEDTLPKTLKKTMLNTLLSA